MSRQPKITPREVIQNVLLATGGTPDRWGNFTKNLRGNKVRCKFQDISMRYEMKNEKYNQWVNVRSDYYKNILVENGTVRVADVVLP